MIHRYKLDKITGPSGIFAGYVLLIVGIVTVYFFLTAIPLILVGGIMAFSFYQSEINNTDRSYRYSIMLFGVYPLGKWRAFSSTDKIFSRKFKGSYVAFSKGNRALENFHTDYRVMLIPSGEKKEIHLAKFETEEDAEKLATELRALITRN